MPTIIFTAQVTTQNKRLNFVKRVRYPAARDVSRAKFWTEERNGPRFSMILKAKRRKNSI